MSYVQLSSVLIVLMFLGMAGCDFETHNPNAEDHQQLQADTADSVTTEQITEIETDTFGIETNNLQVQEERIRYGDTFTRILERQGLNRREAHNLSRHIHPDFNVRRIVSGQRMRFYHNADSLGDLRHIIYQHNRLNYTHIDLDSGSLIVSNNQRETETRLRYADGQIQGSLYQTLRSGNHSTELAFALSEVFAWQLDFHRIRRGDEFRIIYEEYLLNDEPIGVGDIKVAHFNHINDNFFAFRYEEEGNEYYYDEQGNSLRRSYKRAPLRYSRISSHFTDNRYHPVLGRNMPHHGVDYAAPSGTPIYAVGDGTIRRARYDRNNGNYVRIRHNSQHESGYLHMSRLGDGIRAGVEVEQGDLIGYVGSTGLATGPHLCYRFWKNGRPVDPLDIDADPVEPLPEEYMEDYESHIFSLMHLLQQMPEIEDDEQDGALGSLVNHGSTINVMQKAGQNEL